MILILGGILKNYKGENLCLNISNRRKSFTFLSLFLYAKKKLIFFFFKGCRFVFHRVKGRLWKGVIGHFRAYEYGALCVMPLCVPSRRGYHIRKLNTLLAVLSINWPISPTSPLAAPCLFW